MLNLKHFAKKILLLQSKKLRLFILTLKGTIAIVCAKIEKNSI